MAQRTEYAQLASDLAHRLVAGLIVSIPPGPALDQLHRLVSSSDLPTVIHGTAAMARGLPSVRSDLARFFDTAAEWCRSRGRRRLGLISDGAWYATHGHNFEAALEAGGLEHLPVLTQHVPGRDPRAVRQVVQLLMSLPPQRRPDALIVMHDIAAPAVAEALDLLGLRVGGELDVAIHSNFPFEPGFNPEPSFAWLGFDSDRFFDEFLEQLGMADAAAPPRHPGAPPSTAVETEAGLEHRIPPRFAGPADHPSLAEPPEQTPFSLYAARCSRP